MSLISRIGSAIIKPIDKGLERLSYSRNTQNICQNYYNNNRKFINGLGVASIVLRDGLGCVMYVTQSLKNKNIPEEKRKFVAALDLTNGGLMIAMQLLMFFTISNKKVQAKMFNALFGKMFENRSFQKGVKNLIKMIPKYEKLTGPEFYEKFGKLKGFTADAFSLITSLGAATIFAKRMVVPFMATPLADKVERWMNKPKGGSVQQPEKPDSKENKPAPKLDVMSIDSDDTNLINRYKMQQQANK